MPPAVGGEVFDVGVVSVGELECGAGMVGPTMVDGGVVACYSECGLSKAGVAICNF